MKKELFFIKIDQQKENRSSRWVRPYFNFHKKTLRSLRLIKKIKKSITTRIDLNEALSQFVVSDITALEVYFKDIFILIFQFRKDSKDLLIKCHKKGLIKEKFDFDDLVKINYEPYSLPEIILQYQNFQNFDGINSVFSAITDQDFFNFLTNREFNINPKMNFKLDENWKLKLKTYLELRHSLIHDYNPKLRLNWQEIGDLHTNLDLFVLAADYYLDFEFIRENLKDEHMDLKNYEYLIP
jgi:hypothetical protein